MMNFKAIGMVLMVALVALAASTEASAYYYGSDQYQPRIGAYTTYEPYGAYAYNYLAPPTYQTNYGYPWTITNIRPAVYGEPATAGYLPQLHSPAYRGPHGFGYNYYGQGTYGSYRPYGYNTYGRNYLY